MTGTPGRTAIDDQVRISSAEVRPADSEFPQSIGKLAELAVSALGWPGSILAPMKLLGRHIIAVAELMPDAHAERLCNGCTPVLDRTEIATWVWPEMEGRVPPPAARINGVLTPARHWRSGLAAAVPYARFTNAAVVLPKTATVGRDFLVSCPPRARQFGVSMLGADTEHASVVFPGRCFDDTPSVEFTAITRWINEVVYQQLLATEVPQPSHR